MKAVELILFTLTVIGLVFALVDQYPEKRLYILAASLMIGAIWVLIDFLKLKRDIWGKEKFREFISTKKDILIFLILGIIIGYFWGHEGKKPPHEIWLDHNKYIGVVQKPRGPVYTFAPTGEGNYKFVSVNNQVNK